MANINKPRRGQRSSIEMLPKELVQKANQLIKDGYTIKEITDKLNELGADISRSATGRYTKHAREQMQQFKEAQDVAKIWVDRFEKEPDGDVGRLVVDILHMVAYQTASKMGDSEKPVKAAEVMSLAIALEKLSKTKQIDLKTYVDRKQIRQQAEAAAQRVGQRVTEEGYSKETVDFIKAEFLGIAKD